MNPLAGYDACKQFTITHTNDTMSGTTYQMKLTINHGDGVSSGSTLYLDHKSTNWPNDIRFTASDGTTLLDFWREESDATDGTWWVELNALPDHPDDFVGYIHTGDADAADASNGTNTFTIFDHFDAAGIDTAIWQGSADATHCALASSILTFTADSNAWHQLYTKTAVTADFRCRMRLAPHAVDYQYIGPQEAVNFGRGQYLIGHHSGVTNHGEFRTQDAAGASTMSNPSLDYDNYHLYDFMQSLTGTDTARSFLDGAQQGVDKTTNVDTVALYPQFCVYGTSNYAKCDWVFLANYTLNEPVWGAWGSWETGAVTVIKSVPRMARIMLMS